MSTPQQPESGSREQLTGAELSPQLAWQFATHGSLEQKIWLCDNPQLSADVYWRLAEDPDERVASSLALNDGISAEVVSRLAERFRTDANLVALLRLHHRAPLAVRMQRTLGGFTGADLYWFARDAQASPAELEALERLVVDLPHLTLAEGWDRVRGAY